MSAASLRSRDCQPDRSSRPAYQVTALGKVKPWPGWLQSQWQRSHARQFAIGRLTSLYYLSSSYLPPVVGGWQSFSKFLTLINP